MTSGPAPWFRTFPSEVLASTRGLKPSDVGILHLLECILHERGEPIPEDHDMLARRCGATKSTFANALETLVSMKKITRRDGCLWSDDVQAEHEFRAERSSSAKTAANKRWGKTEGKQRRSDAKAMPYQSQSQKAGFQPAVLSRSTLTVEGDTRPTVVSPTTPRSDDGFNHEPWNQGDDGPDEYDGPEEGDDYVPL
ncbi:MULTISPECIES: DUF1376 domain-containing protein [unclassified Mesorhizobium]|uniref:DUF1376 domain-containing protein n=1 Tax=unclassified Mesorhizobium TaxID=325217 RepID=UPI000FCCC248|nr:MULTISPECIES: DUF1376 domain-containing protein [unclassified Mesorhizobium]RUX97158.1 DUF1376 domain-containing protein [Mesorhizobium sp. M7D.F.Ca.US.004.01.2.1]RVA28286.1 DUF1376 domain-containing protein [Mesorhizobium sp. M7D.F.Ca.US.004.03.1.1]